MSNLLTWSCYFSTLRDVLLQIGWIHECCLDCLRDVLLQTGWIHGCCLDCLHYVLFQTGCLHDVYMTFTSRSFSNRLNTWMLFGTMTLWSGKPRLSQISFTYLSRRFIFDAHYGRLRYLLVTEIVCFRIIMMMLPLSGSLSWST